MSKIPLKLLDASGGLNLRDPRSGIRANQVSALKNYLTDEGAFLQKRGGQSLLQYAPIAPEVFADDADTLGLWHLDETTSPYADSSSHANDLNPAGDIPTAVAGVFSNGQKLQRPMVTSGNWTNDGSALAVGLSNYLDDLGEVCLEAWCYIDPSFSAQPITARIAGTDRTLSDSGATLIATSGALGAGTNPGTLVNGISVHRDWDYINNRHSSDCYFKFTLNTKGIPGTVTVLTGVAVPFSRKLHVRGEYSQSTGKMELYVNGTRQAVAIPVGGGKVADTSSYVAIGGNGLHNYTMTGTLRQTFNGWIDEVRISQVTRSSAGFPFRKPLGKPMVLTKADGTNQIVVGTDKGLYYTVGDLEWHEITQTDPRTGALLSATNKWDGALIADRLYMTNGINTPLTWDGTRLVPTFEAVNAPTLTLSAGGSTNTDGTHRYLYTYLYGDLDETGFSPYSEITVTGNKDVNVADLLTRHSNCTAIRVYKTKAGQTSPYFLTREITNNASVNSLSMTGVYTSGGSPDTDTGADGVADGATATNLNNDADYAEADAVVAATVGPKAQYYLGEHNRLFAAGMLDAPYTLRPSALGNPDVMRPTSAIQVPTDRGFIVAIYSYYGEVHVSLNGLATNVLRGSDESNWTLTTNLNPRIGARDHWSVDHRYPIGDAGPYVVVIAGPDGLYRYAGQQFEKISDEINPLFDELSYKNAAREVWLTTTLAEFQAAASNGGSATVNVQQDAYETDGLREVPDEVRIVNQLDYIALFKKNGAPFTGNVIAIAKATGEGAFYFATDGVNELYYTADNFVTVNTVGVTPLAPGERIIQIVRRGTDDFWFCLTDSAGTDYSIGSTVVCKSSGGGKVYAWDNVGGAWVSGADTLYYDLDVPIRMDGGAGLSVGGFGGRVIGGGIGTYSPNNAYINHAQIIHLSRTQNTVNSNNGTTLTAVYANGTTIQGSISDQVYGFTQAGTFRIDPLISVGAGFVGCACIKTNTGASSPFDVQLLRLDYTRREYPRWRGGTFSPQALWDGTKLVFLASGAESSGNRTSQIRSVNSALTLTTYVTSNNVAALAWDGTNYYWTTLAVNTAGSNPYSFVSTVNKGVTLGTPTLSGSNLDATIPLFLGVDTTGGKLIAAVKTLTTSGQEFWTYTGRLKSYLISTLALDAALLDLAANGDSGPALVEFAQQTTTPYKWFAGVQKITGTTLYSADLRTTPATAVVFKATSYQGEDAAGAQTGILSNLIFVESSNSPGDFKWADRLYWMGSAATATDARLLQLGVPGTWEIHAEFVSSQRELGTFDAFGNLQTDFEGNVNYFFRNAANPASLAVSDLPEAPNQPMAGFGAPTAWAQWRVTMVWSYSVVRPTTSPLVRFVLVEFFRGAADVPRPVGIHWAGRTYFAFARNGQAENDVVVVYDKKNAFTTYEGWRIKGFARFRGMLVALQDYALVQLETGTTDLGARIDAEARTGVLASEPILSIQDFEANVKGSKNRFYPNQNGAIEIVPMGGEDELDATWIIPIQPSSNGEISRVHGIPADGFDWAWGHAFSILIRTSQRTTTYQAITDQQEVIQQIDMSLVSAKMGRNFEGK